jgi:hypothetical protein
MTITNKRHIEDAYVILIHSEFIITI